MNKKVLDIGLISILIIIILGIVIALVGDEYLFGSTTDFVNQHSIFPDYLRSLFYESGSLFPDFMPHLGGGQNIYNISYYGLYNPVIMISYLLPFIRMVDYLVVVSILSVIASSILFYYYLIKHNYSRCIAFLGSLLLITASPILFHSHRHLMFVNYMPFLILGMYGVDKYLKDGKLGLLVLSLSLMIYSSYYYSVGGFIALFIYLLYRYFVINSDVKSKKFIIDILKSSVPFLLSVLIGSLILIPTVEVILSGRGDNGLVITLSDLFTLDNGLLYLTYGMGLSIFTLIGLIYGLIRFKIRVKMLCIFILYISTVPLFNYILNGFMYIDFKALIPFIPLAILTTVMFLDDIYRYKIFKYSVTPLIVIISVIICFIVNDTDGLINKEEYYDYYDSVTLINEYLNSIDNSYYKVSYLENTHSNMNMSNGVYRNSFYSSTSNLLYRDFYYDLLDNDNSHRNLFMISASNNIISQIYLSEKYIVTEDSLGDEYLFVDRINGLNIYENINVLPVGYVSNNYISNDDFNDLDDSRGINLLGNVISDIDTNTDLLYLEELDYEFVNIQNLTIDGNIFESSGNGYIRVDVDSDELVLISFDVEPRDYDYSIIVEGINNRLTNGSWKYYNMNETFSYVVDGSEDIDIFFQKGDYKIENFKVLEIPNEYLVTEVDEFIVDMDQTRGDNIVGNINVSESGTFVLNIPYDNNFNIKVDGEEVNYELVNEAFIGFDISSGKHLIEIEYDNMLKNLSMSLSFIGVVITLAFGIRRKL